jgi:hypothetical protein
MFACVSYEEEDTCLHVCHMRRRIHVCHERTLEQGLSCRPLSSCRTMEVRPNFALQIGQVSRDLCVKTDGSCVLGQTV